MSVEEGREGTPRRAAQLLAGGDSVKAMSLRHLINDAIDEYTNEHPDWSPYEPDDVKEVSRLIRDRINATSPIVVHISGSTQRGDL